MKILYMRKDALNYLKMNMSDLYPNYYLEDTPDWITRELGYNPFIEIDEVDDFSLTTVDRGLPKSVIDINNCKILYNNLMNISPSLASEEMLWAGIGHSHFYNYLRKRWDMHITDYNNEANPESLILGRIFFNGASRSAIYRNTLAKYWWVGRNTYDLSNMDNHYQILDYFGTNDISTIISDVFYSNHFASNPYILQGIAKAVHIIRKEYPQVSQKNIIRPAMRHLNVIGGNIILDYLTSEEITNILLKKLRSILEV